MRQFICVCGIIKSTFKKNQKYCSHSCWSKTRTREKSANWKGGRRINQNGYVLILKPEHPFCDIHGYVFEHRFVMERELKRFLKQNEIVHHIDGDKQNNNIVNLILTKHGEHERLYHIGIHRKKRVKCLNFSCLNITTEGNICRQCYKRNWREKKRKLGIKPT